MSNRIEITDFTAPELDVYARIPEVQLLRFYEPKPGLFIAESPKVIQRAANAGYQPVSFLVQHKDLEKEGKNVVDVEGGYRSYLRYSLSQFTKQEENLGERTAQIERSLIKKFRKPIWRRFTKAIKEYELIQEGDKIAVCISGGKDSMLLAKLIQEIKKHGQISFDAI